MKAERILYCIFGLFLFAACSGGGDDYEQQLEWFEEMNRTDVPLCVDSVQPLVRHYDHWWHSRNHRMRAYYMLGCAYRDQGEAPAAIHYYNIATEQADTTNKNCDYATLFRIYGQMAIIYGQQNMPQEKKEALTKYGYYAWMACDTINHIVAYEQMTDVCYMLDDTTGIFAYTDSANMLYRKYGFGELSARVYPTAIYVCLNNNDLQRARKYIDIFEKESGLFDKNGNIEVGREHYYYSKGLYYEKSGSFDSAEYYYRKLIPHGYLYEASKGLLSIYKEQNERDSIVKYVELTEHALGQWAGSQQTNAVIQSSAMYKYERNQNAAIRNAQKAERYKVGSLFIFMVSLYLFWHYRKRTKQQKEKLQLLNQQYLDTKSEYAQLVEEFQILKRSYNSPEMSAETKILIEKKQQRIVQLERILKKYQSELHLLDYKEREKLLTNNEVVVFLNNKKNITPNWKAPRPEKWKALLDIYAKYTPHVFANMNKVSLSKQERLVTILTHLKVNPSDIAHLLETSSSRVSNAKKDACRKLFADEDSGKLRERLIDLECENEVNFFIDG